MMNDTEKALVDYLKTIKPDASDITILTLAGHKEFYLGFVEWLSHRHVVAKSNQYSNAYYIKHKMIDYLKIEGNTIEGFWKELNI